MRAYKYGVERVAPYKFPKTSTRRQEHVNTVASSLDLYRIELSYTLPPTLQQIYRHFDFSTQPWRPRLLSCLYV